MLIAVPLKHWVAWRHTDSHAIAERLRHLAHQINAKQVAISKRTQSKGYVDDKTARAHVAIARVLA